MGATEPAFALRLLGAFRLDAPGAQRVDISSKRGQALIAMLATAGGGERTRSWLQNRLWGSRGNDQAQASLRRELSNLKKAVNRPGAELLKADYNRVWIDLALVQVDLRELDRPPGSELLEGLDIAGEDGFEDWLREERGRIASRAVSAVPAASAPQSPAASTHSPKIWA